MGFAMLGTGSWGQYLLRQLKNVSGARSVAVCDSDETSVAKAGSVCGGNPQATRDYRPILDRKDVEAVIIATPLHLHFVMARDAFLAGEHVFCENALVF